MFELMLERTDRAAQDQHIDFFKDDQFSEGDKLALLNFLMREFDLKQPVVLRETSSAVTAQFLIDHFIRQHEKIDLLYLDADVLRNSAPSLIVQLRELLSRKGVICIESSDANETIDAEVLPAESFEPVLAIPGFSIFARTDGERPLRSMRYQVDLFRRKLCFGRKRQLQTAICSGVPEVVVVVLTYKHEGYIAECLQSVLNQRGNFRLRIIIIDDASPDDTAQVVRSLIAENRDSHIDFDFQTNAQNVGVVANLAAAVHRAAGCDYLTFCEGDDYWTSEDRIQKHIEFLNEHPECVMSFNSIELCDADGGSRKLFEIGEELAGTELEGDELADNNFIGNFTACFYRGELVEIISPEIFEIYTVDWFFNLYCSQFGKIGQLKEVLSVYRQHAGGEWSSRRALDKALELLKLIAQYNELLDYQYDKAFQRYVNRIYGTINNTYSGTQGRLDLLIVDDVFPSLQSGFRYAEFTAYLREFQRSLVLASGKTLHVVENNSINNVVRDYRRKHPEIGGKLVQHSGGFPLRLANLVYVNFLSNALSLLPEIEAANVPFVFTLYPGSGFVLNNPECDRKLKRVLDSPCFQRVIVTQQVSYDYIVHRGLCAAEKVQMIFGVVMPEIPEGRQFLVKNRWGFNKPRLDICFMAHKYTPFGEDKGYDVFVNVAGALRQHHDDIYFHVVGPFDKRVIDVSTISDRIKFHGSLNPDEFDNFFQNMDIILSPNISGKISPGSFDGFPTASCIEAGLRGTAIFAVDEFNSAGGRFTDGEDIVLINYDIAHIIDRLEHYYTNPEALKAVGERAILRIRDLYSIEAQMGPRIELLRHIIRNPVISSDESRPEKSSAGVDTKVLVNCSDRRSSVVWKILRRFCPEPIKKIYRTWKMNHAS
ncbi:glycosyltransferase [Metapseudomonas otitidis]|uniref:glycosyltransferase n=1 Tax=Metapseudomonas otitidis TaxID=319939 RepID=UPI003CF56BF5